MQGSAEPAEAVMDVFNERRSPARPACRGVPIRVAEIPEVTSASSDHEKQQSAPP
jgi:hypothetical protein